MNQNFVEYVKSHIKEYLPMEYQNAVVSINEVTKSNDRLLTGLTILSPGERSAPTIYLEALAEQVEQGLSLDAAMKQIAQIQVENHNRVPLDISVLENYEAIRPMLAVQMCDPETNQEYLKGKPYTSCGDLAAYYRIQVAANEEGTASVAITESMIQMWGITKEQLHKDAVQAANARSPVCLYDMEEVMAESIFSVKPENLFNREEPLDIGMIPMDNIKMPLYGLVFFIAVFGLISLINTLMTNIISRQQEFGILQSVGLSSKQFSKMLQTECFYYVSGTAILTLTIGTLTGFVLCKVFNQVGTFGTLTYHFPVLEISIYFVALFFILAAYSVFSVRYSKRHPVIERIKTME